MNPASWITKDGVSDADLMRSARDMYEALAAIRDTLEGSDSREAQHIRRIAADAFAKARGQS